MTLPRPSGRPGSEAAGDARPGVRAMRLGSCSAGEWAGETRGVWVDVETPTAEQLARLRSRFAMNDLALEDALTVGHWQRFEAYPEHAFIIVRTLAEPEHVTETTERVSIFWYPDLGSVVTIRNEPVTYLENVWGELNDRHVGAAMDVLYALLQRAADTFFAFLDALEDCMDALEQRVFTGPRRGETPNAFATRVFELKHTMLGARRLASGARESVAQFSRYATAVSADDALYLRDVSDHLARVYEGLDSARDVLTSLLDVHLNVQGNRMNEVMKTLTSVSTIFLPLTFLAGVWGMNFKFMPELNSPFGYAFAWFVFIALALALGVYFKRRGWW